MTEDQNKEFDLLQLADEMSHKNWLYFKFLYNEKFREAEQRNKELEAALYAIQSYDRDTLCYDASDVAAMRDIAFAALSGEKRDAD